MAQHRLGLVLVLASSLMGTQLPTGLAAAGDLDTSFSVDGKVITDLTGKWDLAWAVALQTDGKIIAAGASSGSGGRFSLIRYATDGSLDATFSDDGKVLTNFTSGDDWAYDVAIQADGKIVAAGVVAGQGGRFGLARYESNGALDTSFGGDGRVVTNFTSGWDAATGVGVQADGKIVAAGAAADDDQFAVARYDQDGNLDTTFGGDGRVRTNFTSGRDWAWDVAIQADGKIVAAGVVAGQGGRFGLARYESNGALDTSSEATAGWSRTSPPVGTRRPGWASRLMARSSPQDRLPVRAVATGRRDMK